MTIEALRTAFDYTEKRIAGVEGDQWDRATPCDQWNVRDLVNHTVGSAVAMSMAAAGRTPPPGDAPDFSCDDPAAAFRQAADVALGAWPTATDRMVDLGPTEVPGSVGLSINLLEALTHGWDIAKATDQDTELPDEAAQAALAASRMVVSDDVRATAGFATEVVLDDDSPSSTDALVAFLGRRP